jgi:protease-4
VPSPNNSRKVLLIVLLLLVLAIGGSAVAMFALMFAGTAPPTVPSNATVYLRVTAPFQEVQSIDPIFVTPTPTLRETIDAIRQAAKDSRVKTLVVMFRTEGALWAQLQELRGAIVEFRKSGKPVTAYLEYGGAQEYFVASAADRVVMMPAGQLDLTGLTTYELFFRGMFDKIGVYPDMLHIGDYKTASNTMTERGFTPAHREMSKSLNRDWFDQLVAAIAEGRKKEPADIRKLIDEGPFLAEDARKAGLVDELAYEDALERTPPIQGTRKITGENYIKTVYAPFSATNRIALLYAVGTIASGKSSFGGLGGNVLGSDTFAQWVRKVRLDPSIRAIVVRVDSPGGSAIASDVMWHELMLAREVKPVIVSMGDVAASGGYYIAVPAHTIVAEPGTITGSIGVVTGKFVLKGTMEKLGIGTDAVSDGKLAQIYSPFKPFSPEEKARIEDQMRSTYELFLSRVAEGRKSTRAQIDAVGQGRVWTGKQAQELHLVDELGGLDRALQIARQQAKFEANASVDIVVYPMKRSVFEWLEDPLGSNNNSTSLSSVLRQPDARVMDNALSMFRLFRRGEPLMMMPNVFWN